MALITALVELPFPIAIVVLFITMASLGLANGAVFQLVPQRFGAAGGLGDTALIKTLGWSTGAFDGYTAGSLIIAAVVLVAISGISLVRTRWRTT